MKLTVFNGSPRGTHSNTGVILDSFRKGFISNEGNSFELAFLFRQKQKAEFIRLFREAENILIAFPLYFDAMPAIVKDFIESLEPRSGSAEKPTIGFLVHSGLPEATHAQSVERYLKRLASRLGCRYRGTVIKGGIEGIRVPPLQTNPLFKLIIAIGKATNIGRVGHLFDTPKIQKVFYDLGRSYGERLEFDEDQLAKLRQPVKLSLFGFWVVQFAICTFYWNKMLRTNHAYGERLNRPYAKG
jgi:hypothetical protein